MEKAQVVFSHPMNPQKGISVWRDKESKDIIVNDGRRTFYESSNPLEVASLIDEYQVNRNKIATR